MSAYNIVRIYNFILEQLPQHGSGHQVRTHHRCRQPVVVQAVQGLPVVLNVQVSLEVF